MSARVILTSGVWDLLHAGHLNLLWESKQLGDVLIVGVVSDLGCYRYKGLYPRENSQVRRHRIERLGFVDVVVDQHGTDPTEHLERFRPAAMTHGTDWEQLREGHETLARLGIDFIRIPYTEGLSSTLLREQMRVHA
jgi:cytidyltransferase-like protein